MNVYQTLLEALPEKHRDISVYAIFTIGLLILEYAIETIGFESRLGHFLSRTRMCTEPDGMLRNQVRSPPPQNRF